MTKLTDYTPEDQLYYINLFLEKCDEVSARMPESSNLKYLGQHYLSHLVSDKTKIFPDEK